MEKNVSVRDFEFGLYVDFLSLGRDNSRYEDAHVLATRLDLEQTKTNLLLQTRYEWWILM